MLKLSDNPPMRPESFVSIGEMQGTWWVAHTKSRAEKSFAWDLLHTGVGYFLPMIEKQAISGGRKRTTLLPLFPSYVFFCGDEGDRYKALMTHRICQVIPAVDQRGLAKELAAVEMALCSGAVLSLYSFVAKGRRCRVTRGALAGMEGRIEECGNITRLVLAVSMLGQGASLEIDAAMLEPLD